MLHQKCAFWKVSEWVLPDLSFGKVHRFPNGKVLELFPASVSSLSDLWGIGRLFRGFPSDEQWWCTAFGDHVAKTSGSHKILNYDCFLMQKVSSHTFLRTITYIPSRLALLSRSFSELPFGGICEYSHHLSPQTTMAGQPTLPLTFPPQNKGWIRPY